MILDGLSLPFLRFSLDDGLVVQIFSIFSDEAQFGSLVYYFCLFFSSFCSILFEFGVCCLDCFDYFR